MNNDKDYCQFFRSKTKVEKDFLFKLCSKNSEAVSGHKRNYKKS
jgi:hypothetical protein